MIRISLFWRTFALLVFLVVSSIAALLVVLRFLDNAPPEQRLAWEVASVVNLTRSALVSSQPERRITLLRELANEEGIRVLPLEPADEIEVTSLTGRIALLAPRLQNLLGPETLVVSRVNNEEGLWVSFDIDEDKYWLQMQGRRIDRHFGPSAPLILGIAAGLALFGSLALSRLVNKPLADLAHAIAALRGGQTPEKLKEDLASEISHVNRRFNDMATDLAALEQDREVTLAGISHDIRSPLARLRMEAELAPLDDATRASLVEDIERIDAIVGRFIDFARTGATAHTEPVPVSDVLRQLPTIYRAQIQSGEMSLQVPPRGGLTWRGDHTDLERALGNLIDNALRYGRTADEDGGPGCAHVTVDARRTGQGLLIEVSDQGPGVPEDQLARLLRPFARLDTARGGADGAGLGLAIVSRLARRYDGSFNLANRNGGGLRAALTLPDARTSTSQEAT
jgi:two-component system osmolarity sensor histidine kinase EnvZ